jgi:uncharacterized membrane protein (UPF0136 family)
MNASLRQRVLDILQWIGLAIVLCGMVFSNFFMSFGAFWLVGVWLLNLLNTHFSGGSLRDVFSEFLQDKTYWAVSAIYALPVIGLLWTDDFGFALWDLRMKLPILFMPVLIASLRPISGFARSSLIWVFLTSIFVAVLICTGVYYGVMGKEVRNVREASIFISHIRFSILIVLGVIFIYFKIRKHIAHAVYGVPMALIFAWYLWRMESMTGMFMLAVWAAVMLVYHALRTGNSLRRWVIMGAVVIGITGVFIYVVQAYQCYFSAPEINLAALDELTMDGEKYDHHPENRQLQDGNYIWLYNAWGELEATWRERSKLPIDSLDAKGNPLKGTLVRYLTSKGLRKDRDGVMSLEDEEIVQIENGATSYYANSHSGLRKRLDKIFFEIDNYRNGGSPNGHSVLQRLEFWITGIAIFKEHPLMGVGTGDLKQSFKSMYEARQTGLSEKNRLRAHQQFLTMFITYGIIGGLFFIVLVFYPLTSLWNRKNNYYLSFFLLFFLSCLTEDTLETQAGVTFFAFLSPFLIRYFKPKTNE